MKKDYWIELYRDDKGWWYEVWEKETVQSYEVWECVRESQDSYERDDAIRKGIKAIEEFKRAYRIQK